MKIKIKYVVEDTDRHGNVRLYFRRVGQPKIRLRGPVGSPEFLADYREAMHGPRVPKVEHKGQARLVRGSVRWLCGQYFKSAMFTQLDPRTRKVRRSILERFCINNADGDKAFKGLQPRHIRMRRDELADRPEAANSMVKALRQLFNFAVKYEHHSANPAADVEYLRGNPEGFHSWTLAEIEQFEAKHPVGTQARLSLALALYTGQRLSDLIKLGRQHSRDGWLSFTQHKNRNKNPVRLEIPIIPELQRIIDATPIGDMTFLVNERGTAWTAGSFGNRFRKWAREAQLNDCPLHGLRKAAAARLAELGCTEQEIMAITGHRTSKEVARYTRAARQRTRAESAMRRFNAGQN